MDLLLSKQGDRQKTGLQTTPTCVRAEVLLDLLERCECLMELMRRAVPRL